MKAEWIFVTVVIVVVGDALGRRNGLKGVTNPRPMRPWLLNAGSQRCEHTANFRAKPPYHWWLVEFHSRVISSRAPLPPFPLSPSLRGLLPGLQEASWYIALDSLPFLTQSE